MRGIRHPSETGACKAREPRSLEKKRWHHPQFITQLQFVTRLRASPSIHQKEGDAVRDESITQEPILKKSPGERERREPTAAPAAAGLVPDKGQFAFSMSPHSAAHQTKFPHSHPSRHRVGEVGAASRGAFASVAGRYIIINCRRHNVFRSAAAARHGG